MKKKVIFTCICLVSIILAAVVQADMESAKKAYDSGDFKAAHKEYLAAAQQGNPEAQGWCGYMYLLGKGVSKGRSEALKWYKKGAAQGDNLAMNGLGYMYESGKGVGKNYGEAAKWYRKAAEQGFPKSQSNLGLLYAQGKGVKKDAVMAYLWLSLAASKNYPKADKRVNKVKKKMTPAQLKEGEKLFKEWKGKN